MEEPVEPQQEETKTTTTTPQEQEEVPTTEEETPQQQEEGQQQPAVEEEQPAAEEAQPVAEEAQPVAEEAQPQPQPVEQAEVKVSYVKEDDTDLMESVTATYDVGYRLDQDTNVFKEAHEAFEFEYAFVNGNKENKITKDQVKASGLTVTSDMTSLTLVYKSTATQKDSKDKKVETANLSGEKEDDSDSEDDLATVASDDNTATNRTIRVGDTITLTSRDVDKYNYYNHNWTVEDGSKVKLNKTSGVSITVTGLQEGTTIVTDTYSWRWEKETKEYTITVNSAVAPTGISIIGEDTVKQFQTTQLTANLTPADANGKVTWTSSNEQILSVDENGLVTGNRQGSATITASVQGANNKTLSATKTIEVVKNESPSGNNRQQALVYYLKDPNSDANSNGSDQWGPDSIGTAIVNVEGATWTGDKNCFDNVDQRVVSWPNGTNVISRDNKAWNLIFDAYKASIESKLGLTITKDDVEEITLAPAKISRNNGTNPDMHLDCNVNIKCKSVALVKYYLFDANGTNWEMLGSKNYLVKDESTTQPSDVTSKDLPETKEVNGVTYTLSDWYTDQSLTTPAPSFPAKVTGSVNYYAKYVAGYQVKYDLAGGQFSDGSTSATEKHNVDTDVVVKEAPTRKGYKFTGWTVEGLDGTTTINSGDSFTMPNGNVTLTANWEKKDIKDYVTLTTKDVKLTYNGQSHAAGEATVVAKAGKENEIGKLTVEYQKADGKWTKNREEITAKDVSDSKTVNVRVSSDDCLGYVTGAEKLTINPATLTVKTEGAKRAYNGKPLTAEGTITGFVNGETAKFTVTGSQTTVGQSKNTYNIDWKAKDTTAKKGNYTISEDLGYLVVTQFAEKITVTTTGGEFTYDGNAHGATVAVTGLPAGYTVETATSDATATDVTEKAVKAGCDHLVIKDDQGKDVTSELKVDYKAGTIQINPATLTVKTEGAKRAYNGKPLTAEGTITGFVNGETAKFTVTGSQTTVGQSKNTYNIDWKAKDTTAKKGNYTISEDLGYLVVISKSIVPDDKNTPEEKKTGIKVTAPKDTTYSGNEQKREPVIEDTKTGKTLDKDDYSLSYSDDVTNAGTVTITVTGKGNYTGKFEVTYKINPRKVTLKSETASKPYDGTALTKPAVTVSGDGFVKGEVSDIKATGSVTTVSEGEVTNTITFTKEKNYKDGNYTIDKDEGKLSIRATTIDPGTDPEKPNPDYTGAKVNSPSDTVYDGNEHKWSPTVTDKADKKLKAGTDYTVEYSTKNFKDVGTIEVVIKGKGNYTGTVTRTYKITPKSVTVTADDKTKVFGETDPELTATVAGTLGNDTVDYKLSREDGEAVGKYTITASGNAEQGNYSVTYVAGTLTITSQSIDPGTDPEKPNPDYTGAKVNSPSDKVYDGNEHKWIPTVTDKADKKLKAGKDYTVEYSTKNFKDVGTIDVTITGIGNYTGTVTRTYKITPKSVTVTAEDKTKVFGETDPKLTAKVAGTLGNDTVEYTLSRETGEAAGKYEITVKGDKLQGNYTVTYVAGTLTITSQSIDPGTDPEKPNPDYTGAKVNSPKDSVYDGKDHKWSPTVTDKSKKLELGKDYTVEYSTSDFTNVGTIKVTITGIGNYSGTVKRSYKVTPKEYTVTTDSATKTYSGTALTAGGKIEGIVSGETVEFTTTGSQTEVGTSKNTYELVWKSAKATNYTLAKESIGKLTVKAKSIVPDDKDTPESDKTGITVNEPSDSKYDGKEHKEVLTVTDTKTGKELVAGTDYSVTYSSDLVNAGTVKVTVAGLGNYSGSFTKTYKITKRSVTLTSATVSKVYDGSALTNTSITVSGDGFVEGEGASYEVTGSQTVVGNSANSFEYKLNENTLASNYNITKVVGTLTITAAPAPVTPTTPSTPSSTTSTTPRTPSAPQVTTPVETVEKETTPKTEPKKEEKVEEEYTPKASPQYYWALINLICAILTVLFGLLLLISKRHKDEDDDEDDDETKQQTNNDDEENEQEKKRGLFTRVLAVLIAIVSVVFFLVTEDLSLPWTWTDQWTIWMVVIGLVQIVVFFVGRKWKNVDDDEDEEEAQQA